MNDRIISIMESEYLKLLDLQQENQQLKEELEKIKQPTVFIDTEDMEERYGEGLYMDYLKEENQQLKVRINKAIEYILADIYEGSYEWLSECDGNIPGSDLPQYVIEEILKILKGDSNE